jgi:glutathione S-transferase
MKYLLVSLFCSFLSMSNGLTLYGHPGTRSPLCNWGAYEVGIDIEMGDLSKNPHPFGQIPCLTDDDDVLVFESGAILHYFHGMTKDSLTKSRAAAVTSWITWANASLDPICFLETPEGKGKGVGLSSFSGINLQSHLLTKDTRAFVLCSV